MARVESLYRRVPIWAQQLLLNGYALRREFHSLARPGREALERLFRQERWGREEIRDYQDRRVREIVPIAYARSPYYREVMNAARLRPADIRGVADLAKLPLLTSAIVRARMKDLLTAPRPELGWLHGHTSGTTGSPLSMWYDRQTCIENNAQDRRQKAWGGLKLGDWIGMLLGRVIVPPGQRRPPYWRVNVVQREVWFSSLHMSEESLGFYVAEIRRRRLRFLEGYPSTLFILATYLRRHGLTLPMHSVFTSSETLHPLQRERIEEAFACRVFDFYGLAERTIFAGECEAHCGRHIAEDFGYLEIVDQEGIPVPTGSWGYLVGTSLHNVALPFLRYRTTDVSRVLEGLCVCGCAFRVLDPVTTKAEDVIQTPDGRLIPPSILTHPFKPFDTINKSQLIQETLDCLLVKVVAGRAFTSAQQDQLVADLRVRLGRGMRIKIVMVDDIPPERSGKYRWIISRVESGYSPPWERFSTTHASEPGA